MLEDWARTGLQVYLHSALWDVAFGFKLLQPRPAALAWGEWLGKEGLWRCPLRAVAELAVAVYCAYLHRRAANAASWRQKAGCQCFAGPSPA
jgi:hypothetical protein